MVVQIVRFKSSLPEEEVRRQYEARAPRYRSLQGLVQKYYLSFPATGEAGAVYVWETPEALAQFRESELARTIPEAYRVQGKATMETAEVAMTLRPGAGASPR